MLFQILAKVSSTLSWLPKKSIDVIAVELSAPVLKCVVAFLEVNSRKNEKLFFFEASYLKITKEMYLMLASTCKLACTAILKDIVYPLFYFCPSNPFG